MTYSGIKLPVFSIKYCGIKLPVFSITYSGIKLPVFSITYSGIKLPVFSINCCGCVLNTGTRILMKELCRMRFINTYSHFIVYNILTVCLLERLIWLQTMT